MASGSKGRRKQPLWVVDSAGGRARFLRGIVTHDLMGRGLDFDEAYAVARAVRDQLSDRQQVETGELNDLIQQQLESTFGADMAAGLAAPPDSDLRVVVATGEQPFSRGLLARSILAAGVDLDGAYRLVIELEGQLRRETMTVVSSDDLARRVGDLLYRLEGKGTARRYRLMRRMRDLPRPVVIYLGGASGTGKSTLALELAPLLRIYRINATDTVRQVMRMLFSPQILPAIHGSSFDAFPPGAEDAVVGDDVDLNHRALAAFNEQAVRIMVGVRAVVERSIEERMSVLVEGVHLVAPLIPFADLEGAAYQVPIMLGTRDRETHRARFLRRSRGNRSAESYLSHFDTIRAIHDHILEQAENDDLPMVDTSQGQALRSTLRVITSVLRQRLPRQTLRDSDDRRRPPTLLLIIDGVADRPVRALVGRTPLAVAELPTLDRLASEGQCGLADPIAPGVVPDTAAGTLALFGQSPMALKRGPVEALGAGLELDIGDIALRGNLATQREGHVIDRRAGRIRSESTELAKAIDRLPLPEIEGEPVQVRVKAATEHRLAIILQGESLSPAITGSDPGDAAVPGLAQTPAPLDINSEAAVRTARALELFEQRANELLDDHPINRQRIADGLPAANVVLSRGAGRIHRLVPLEDAGDPLAVTCIAGDQTVQGIARWVGAQVVTDVRMTANLDTDLDAKFDAAKEALAEDDLVVVHIKGADIAAHDQKPELKVDLLQRLDVALGKMLKQVDGPLRVAVASDHATLSDSGRHAADPVPVLLWGAGIEADDVTSFDEGSVALGSLQRFPLQMLLGRLFALS